MTRIMQVLKSDVAAEVFEKVLPVLVAHFMVAQEKSNPKLAAALRASFK